MTKGGQIRDAMRTFRSADWAQTAYAKNNISAGIKIAPGVNLSLNFTCSISLLPKSSSKNVKQLKQKYRDNLGQGRSGDIETTPQLGRLPKPLHTD
jgi:hypothetical protein